jgi:hypothetical protein
MWFVGQPAVREGVSLEEVDEFIVDGGSGGWPKGDERAADRQDCERRRHADQGFAAGEGGQEVTNVVEDSGSRRGSQDGPGAQGKSDSFQSELPRHSDYFRARVRHVRNYTDDVFIQWGAGW